MKFSVVIPTYKCSLSLKELSKRLIKTLERLSDDFEMIFVNDASPENDWEVITDLAKNDNRIKGLNFSRNFGQHYAITAGLDYAKGDWIIVMDGDLQDQPEEIIKLYNKAQEGYDIVLAQRINRQDSKLKKFFSTQFYKVFGYLTDTKYDNTIANFGIYSKKTIDAVLQMKDKIRVFPILLQWVGFKKISIEIIHNERSKGKSSYSYRKLVKLAFEIIMSFSNKPLLLSIRVGIFISILSLIIGIIYLYKYFTGQILISGFASLIISIWFLSGIIIFSIGVVGIYIGKVFDASKDRPLFIIKNTIGDICAK
ncbi:MAG: glycosyltransferase family 2 protein [Bacteroidales bacterium]|nr:glycosyltransferase family 2 protein [Bacteroidales bacterium]